MRRIFPVGITVMALAMAFPTFAHAQDPWSLEIRAGGNVPAASFMTTDVEAGLGFEGSIRYRIASGLSFLRLHAAHR